MKKKNLVCFESGGVKKHAEFSEDKEDIGMTAMKEINEKEPEMEEIVPKKCEEKKEGEEDKKQANSSTHEFFLFADKYPENFESLKEYYGLDDVKNSKMFNLLVAKNKTLHKP